ncbi:MAG: FHA domain-containing protein, partial [Ktedonobacterales bacterium]
AQPVLAQPVAAAVQAPIARGLVTPTALDDPARADAAYADGLPWGSLTPVGAPADSLTATPVSAIPLTRRLTLIGREATNDIVLDDERISRRHAELRWDRGRVEFADYGSLNGTVINEQAARGRALLRGGDIIQLGKRRYQLVLRPADAALVAGPASTSEQDAERLETRKTARAALDSAAFGRPALRLVALQGASAGASWPLSAAAITIGRDSSCGIVLPDTVISRVHAQVTRQPAGYFIADLESSNGVWLNGERLTGPAQVVAGDVITLGDSLLRCETIAADGTSADAASLSPPIAASAAETAASAAETPAPSPASLMPTGAPEFHMRIAPERDAGAQSRPRFAPPRLRPTAPQPDTPPD